MTIRKGEEWGRPATSGPDREITGGDGALAQWVATSPGALVRLRPTPDSDLGRAVGLVGGGDAPAGRELPLDALRLADGALAVNMVVLGAPPDRLRRISRRIDARVSVDGTTWLDTRATTIVVATGQFLRGLDVVPRGHPGDGRAEIQLYRLRPGERRPMRARLGTGSHVPHPRIAQRTGRSVVVETARPLPLEVDGRSRGTTAHLVVDLVPNAYRLLV